MSIKSSIDIDKEYCMTPDLPYLRYLGKAIPIFLWDDLQDFRTLEGILTNVDVPANYESKFHSALTVNSYVPWYNMESSPDTYASYCLEEHEDLDFLSIPEYTIGDPLPVKGKVANVSLKALEELDVFYENERLFTRQAVKVYPSQWSKTAITVYTWLNGVDQISVFDEKSSEYVLDKDLDFTPFATQKTQQGEEHYGL